MPYIIVIVCKDSQITNIICHALIPPCPNLKLRKLSKQTNADGAFTHILASASVIWPSLCGFENNGLDSRKILRN